MGGHLFVLRGDLTQLHCSAVLIPCDSKWRVVWKHWSRLLPRTRFELGPPYGARLIGGPDNVRFTDVGSYGNKLRRLVVTARQSKGESPEEIARWVADGVVAAIANLATRRIPPAGRVKPLVGLPLVGTGFGGFRRTRGVLIEALIPALQEAASDYDVDIALVLIDDRDHAAVQAVRTKYWADFAGENSRTNISAADRLGVEAANGHLSLFLGSGVSVPLGVPDWKALLTKAGGREIDDFDAEKAPEIAQGIEEKRGKTEFRQRIANAVKVPGVAPTHLLLAALSVRQTVTTNYDIAYERALDTTMGRRRYQVLTRQLALQPHPWLLKLHGCATRPEEIVITENDYTRLREDFGALQSVVETLMMTSHLMFVGFSMGDPNFVDAANRVKAVRELADGQHSTTVATVLALDRRAVSTHPDFKVVPMLDSQDPQKAARLLEIFLDRVSWKATTHGPASSTYLLHRDYQDLFTDEEPVTKLREKLGGLVKEFDPSNSVWASRGWKQVAELLSQLGDDRFGDKAPIKGAKEPINLKPKGSRRT